MRVVVIIGAALLIVTSVVQAATIHVPADQPTIQAGIDVSTNGDEVVIADGTYTGVGNKNLDFRGKAITVRSASGDPELCVIDCEGDGRGFFIHNSEQRNSVIDGLMVASGYYQGHPDSTEGGGAFRIAGSSPTIRNCCITKSTTNNYGGALYISSSDPLISNCIISQNIAEFGGGCYLRSSDPTFVNCVFSGNSALSEGGGVGSRWSDPSYMNCRFWGNTAEYGGGMSCIQYSSPRIMNCLFSGNAARGGGGIQLDHNYCELVIVNSVFSGNEALAGGGIYNTGSTPVLENCILWGNGEEIFDSREPCEIRFSCIRGGYPGEGNITRNPLFLNPTGIDGIAGTEDDDLRLLENSPCNNAGSNESLPVDAVDLDGDGDTTEAVPLDLLGGCRLIGSDVDMGAYEHAYPEPADDLYPCRLYVDASAVPGGDGLAWDSAFVYLQDALARAVPGSEIWVAHGVYYPDQSSDAPEGSGDRDASFWLCDGVSLQGGFSGIETSLDQRPARVYPEELDPDNASILSGDIGIVEDPEDNTKGVIRSRYAGHGTVMSGFSITQSSGGYNGGGMLTLFSDVQISKCVFINNASNGGAGLFNWGGNTSLSDCIFSGNVAEVVCGGVFNYKSGMMVSGCVFHDNSSGEEAGGIGNYDSNSVISHCVFKCNSSQLGGGMRNDISTPEILHCIFVENIADQEGGGMYNTYYSDPHLSNCVFHSNHAGSSGGGLCNIIGANPSLKNCICWDNYPNSLQNIEFGALPSNPIVTYSLIQGGQGESWFGVGCIDVDPMFVDVDGADDDPATWEDNDYRLSAGSPCIDAGDNSAVTADVFDLDGDGDVTEPVPFDLLGNLRFVDDPDTADAGNGDAPIVDMGAYEYQPVVVGDLDRDGDVDLDDFALFADCLAGPGVVVPSAGVDPAVFALADLDGDGDVDLKDFGVFQENF